MTAIKTITKTSAIIGLIASAFGILYALPNLWLTVPLAALWAVCGVMIIRVK